MRKKYFRAFTLVELIVVITILSILSTIGFIAYTDYLKDVRDSSRLNQMSWIYSALELLSSRVKLPIPESSVNIVAETTPIGFQWKMGNKVLELIKYTDGGKDPKTKNYFTYRVSSDRKYAQLLGFLEQKPDFTGVFSQKTSASETSFYSNPYVFWAKLGVLLEKKTQVPIEDVYSGTGFNILDSNNHFNIHIANGELVDGASTGITSLIPNGSCKSILWIFPNSQDGIYKINPNGDEHFPVYCNMTLDGWWWTLVAKSRFDADGKDELFGWFIQKWEVYNTSLPYSLGPNIKNIHFWEVIYGAYDTGYDFLTKAELEPGQNSPIYKFLGNRSAFLSPNSNTEIETLTGCKSTHPDIMCIQDTWSWNKWWGAFDRDSNYFFPGPEWFYHRGVYINSKYWRKDGLEWPWPVTNHTGIMIFVR